MSDRGTILVIDDEETIRRACERILEDQGYRVLLFPIGEEVLPVLEREEISVVVLDLWMPGVGGMVTLERMQREGFRVPVVVITGYATRETKEECEKLGARVWLPKPFDPDQLIAAVEEALVP